MSLTIEKQEAKRLYPEAPEWMQKRLINEFGDDIAKENDFEKIKTFEDACASVGVKPESVFSSADTYDEVAYKKLKVIAKAINAGWTPNWKDNDQRKWFPWFNLSSGFGFSDSYYYFTDTNTSVGSRLCFESQEKAVYAGNQFLDLYEDLLTIKQ